MGQPWVGHESPSTTLQVYAYCMPRDDETGRTALREAATLVLAEVHPMCTGAETDGRGEAVSP
jgi:hypothetical protein